MSSMICMARMLTLRTEMLPETWSCRTISARDRRCRQQWPRSGVGPGTPRGLRFLSFKQNNITWKIQMIAHSDVTWKIQMMAQKEITWRIQMMAQKSKYNADYISVLQCKNPFPEMKNVLIKSSSEE
jgi:hypothetical protein